MPQHPPWTAQAWFWPWLIACPLWPMAAPQPSLRVTAALASSLCSRLSLSASARPSRAVLSSVSSWMSPRPPLFLLHAKFLLLLLLTVDVSNFLFSLFLIWVFLLNVFYLANFFVTFSLAFCFHCFFGGWYLPLLRVLSGKVWCFGKLCWRKFSFLWVYETPWVLCVYTFVFGFVPCTFFLWWKKELNPRWGLLCVFSLFWIHVIYCAFFFFRSVRNTCCCSWYVSYYSFLF